jgi:alkylation response protein AidB-like acyl-CoA dehydrogenase
MCGEFMLTEIGHGLDARNIETTATLQPDGSFDLNTPTFTAAKIMPPTTLAAGVARVAVVFAQLVIDGERRGVRPFIVRINEVDSMCNGVSTKALPKRAGAKAVDHAVTFFDHVRLDSSALLGTLEKPRDLRSHFLSQIWRVSIGTLALSMINPAHLALCAWTVGRYSQRREVSGTAHGSVVPIISFRTQQRPILHALAHAAVFSQFSNYAQAEFMRPKTDPRVAHGVACVYKALVVQTSQKLMNDLVDRLGWQGLFGFNTITEQLLATRGNAIAEGDILVLCIRLASELLLGRYALPVANDPNGLLARREAGLIASARRKIAKLDSNHRGADFNAHILPRCRPIVEAIAQRMAYEAALSSKATRPEYLELFELHCMLHDPIWFIEEAGIRSDDILAREAKVIDELMPRLDELLDETHAEPHATAPIITEERFLDFVDDLPTSHGKPTKWPTMRAKESRPKEHRAKL